MKNDFLEDPTGRQKMDDLLDTFRKWLYENPDEIDLDVIRQRSRFTKFGCWLIYGHTEEVNEKGRCKRCGKKIIKNGIH